ncbi:MAG: peroxiredoxin [Actinomycetes bacterium]
MIEIGHEAPDFTLLDQHGESVSLSQFRGSKNVLLLFYPYAFSSTCTGELCTIRDRVTAFDNDETVTLAVSIDHKYTLRAFADQEGYTFPLLADFWPHGAVATAYGVFVEAKGAAKRGTFIIDKAGIVRWSVIHEMGEARDADDYEKALAALPA